MDIALGVRKGTTFNAGGRICEGAGPAGESGIPVESDCGREPASANRGGAASIWTSGTTILFVAFISTPEMLPLRSAKRPQKFTQSGPNSQGKEWSAKMPLLAKFVNLWKTREVSYLQLDSYSTR